MRNEIQRTAGHNQATGSGQQLAQHSASSVAAEVARNLHNLTPATANDITIAVAPCLALVGGVGMNEEGRIEWLRAATEALRGMPTDLLRRGCDAAKRRADHPSKIIPAIMDEVQDTWEWRKAQRSAPLDNRHIEPEKKVCTPEEATEILKRYRVGSYAKEQPASYASQPTQMPATADPDRPSRKPTREDYIRLFGIDPEAPSAPPAAEAA
ncbi:hypothetical protein [Sphingomonas sp. 1P08PE]|uniref:hypothetical protein n=1 Tax=Sphingomonas sp. 1P08PE TaxID=554122 RepID=UPI0039A3015D